MGWRDDGNDAEEGDVNDKLDPLHTAACLVIYGGGITLTIGAWRGVYAVLRTLGLVPWQAVTGTVLIAAVAVALVAKVAVGDGGADG